MLKTLTALTAEQKRAALEQALNSETFARSGQLRSFLQYVCDLEIAGQENQITEYSIGVEALGRPKDFAPGEDSAVRNQARSLRRKLDELYAREIPDAQVRIDLPKGSYCPRFIEHEVEPEHEIINAQPVNALVATTTATTAAVDLPHPLLNPTVAAPKRERFDSRYIALLAFVTGTLLTGLIAFVILWTGQLSRTQTPHIAPIISEAWGPLTKADANVLICVATPLQTWVREFETKPADLTLLDAPPELYERYARRAKLKENHKLYQLTHENSPLWGDALSAMSTVRVLSAAGASYQILPERVSPLPSLRGRNAIIIGLPEYSEAISQLLQRGQFEFKYDASVSATSIVSRESPSIAFTPKRDEERRMIHTYGLITVLPSEGAEDDHRTIILSGISSAGAQGAAEFFSSPASLAEFQQRLKDAGHTTFPRAYQIVVKTTSNSALPRSVSYETHRVLQ